MPLKNCFAKEDRVPNDDGISASPALLDEWTPWELNAWRRVESTWSCLSSHDVQLQRPQPKESDWEYGPEATNYLDALDHFFKEIDERRRSPEVDWGKPIFTQCLAKLQNSSDFADANLWDLFTYLRAATRFSRFPDNNDGGWFSDHFIAGGISHAMKRLRELAPMAEAEITQLLPISAAYYDSLANRIPVVRSDSSNEPMGPRSAAVLVGIRLSAEAMNVVRLGLLPAQMEDKWFLFFEEPFLHFHRSWTGFEAFTMKIEDRPKGHFITVIQVSQNAESVNYESADEGAEQAFVTLCACLLGIELLSHAAGDVVHQWHTFGQQTLGHGPSPGKRPTQSS